MFSVQVTRVVVTDTKLFAPRGDVYRWADGIETEFRGLATMEAPSGVDTGRIHKTGMYPVGALKQSIMGHLTRTGPRHLRVEVSVNVPYAMYVLKGTNTIYARTSGGQFRGGAGEPGSGMYIPANPGWGVAKWRQRVRGQAANNFLARAYDRTAARHRSLKRGAIGSF